VEQNKVLCSCVERIQVSGLIGVVLLFWGSDGFGALTRSDSFLGGEIEVSKGGQQREMTL